MNIEEKRHPYPYPGTAVTDVIHNIPPAIFANVRLIRSTAVWGESIILIMPPGTGAVRCSWLRGDSRTMIISDLVVAEDYRCRGIARTLMDGAFKISALSGSSTMLLSVDPDSFMRRVYLSYGFRPTGERDENGLDIMTRETPAFEISPDPFPCSTYHTVLAVLPKGARIIVTTASGKVVAGTYQGTDGMIIAILNNTGRIDYIDITELRKKFGE